MGDLKPCPFCGGEAEIDDFLVAGMSAGHWAVCPECGSQGEVSETEVEAIAAWNTRATPPEVTALVEALRFYRDGWKCKPNKRYGGLEWSPKEELLDDCGNAASAALTKWEAAQK